MYGQLAGAPVTSCSCRRVQGNDEKKEGTCWDTGLVFGFLLNRSGVCQIGYVSLLAMWAAVGLSGT